MKILNRFRIFGLKEFWISYWEGIKRGMRINKRMIEVNKLYLLVVILNMILMPVMFPVSMLMVIFNPEQLERIGEAVDDIEIDLDL